MVVALNGRALNLRKLAYQLPIYGLCLLLTVIYILPFAWMILSSFKSGAEIAQVYGFSWLPRRWMIDNYVKVWVLLPLFRGLLNSAIVSVGTVVLVIDLIKAKPATSKGTYLQKVSVSSTMGPGVTVDQSSLTLK